MQDFLSIGVFGILSTRSEDKFSGCRENVRSYGLYFVVKPHIDIRRSNLS